MGKVDAKEAAFSKAKEKVLKIMQSDPSEKAQDFFTNSIKMFYLALYEEMPVEHREKDGHIVINGDVLFGFLRDDVFPIAPTNVIMHFDELSKDSDDEPSVFLQGLIKFAMTIACNNERGKIWALKPVFLDELGIELKTKTNNQPVKKSDIDMEDMAFVDDEVFFYTEDEVKAQLAQIIPKECKNYYPKVLCSEDKKLDNPLTDLDTLRVAYEEKLHVLLQGETGSGKTLSLKYLAWELEVPYKSLSFNGACSIEDLLGSFIPATSKRTGKYGWYWTDGWLAKMARYGGIFVAEEINSAPPEILFVLHDLLGHVSHKLDLTQMGGDVIDAHPQFFFAATMNPDYEGTCSVNKALMDRFDIVLEYDYDREVETKLIADKKLLSLASKLRLIYPQELSTPCSTRMLEQFETNKALLGFNAARAIFINKFPQMERSKVKEIFDLQMGQK